MTIDQLVKLLNPELAVLGAAFVLIAQNVFAALAADPKSPTPPAWAKLAVIFVLAFILSLAYNSIVPAVEKGVAPTITALWWVQWIILFGQMTAAHLLFQGAYGPRTPAGQAAERQGLSK